MIRILVTGSNGFLGSHLSLFLQLIGHDVVGFSNVPNPDSDIETIIGDVRNPDDVRNAVRDVDFVFHLAALSTLKDCEKNPDAAMDINYGGTKNLIDALEERVDDVKGFLLSSSIQVYDISANIVTEQSPLAENNVYSRTKILAEKYAMRSPVPTIVMRHSNIYGPGQPDSYAIPSIVSNAIRDGRVKIINPNISRDFIYIDDVLTAYNAILNSPSDDIYNISSGENMTLRDIIDVTSSTLCKNIEIEVDSNEPHVPIKIDSTKFRNRYSWIPRYDIEMGISKMIEFYRTRTF